MIDFLPFTKKNLIQTTTNLKITLEILLKMSLLLIYLWISFYKIAQKYIFNVDAKKKKKKKKIYIHK